MGLPPHVTDRTVSRSAPNTWTSANVNVLSSGTSLGRAEIGASRRSDRHDDVMNPPSVAAEPEQKCPSPVSQTNVAALRPTAAVDIPSGPGRSPSDSCAVRRVREASTTRVRSAVVARGDAACAGEAAGEVRVPDGPPPAVQATAVSSTAPVPAHARSLFMCPPSAHAHARAPARRVAPGPVPGQALSAADGF